MATIRKAILGLTLLPLLILLLPAANAGIEGKNIAVPITCRPSHQNADDPIVFPGQRDASHLHQFFGARTTDAFSTVVDEQAGDAVETGLQGGATTCRTAGDTSAAWIPTVSYNGTPVTPRVMGIYYMSRTFAKVEAPPIGMQLVIGNGRVAGDGKQVVFWTCSDGTKSLQPVKCAEAPVAEGIASHSVTLVIRMPNCWDGEGLTTAHFVYSGGVGLGTGTQGTCPPGFPRPIAQIELHARLRHPSGGDLLNPYNPDGSIAVSFSSGNASTAHGDYFNTWVSSALKAFVDGCVNRVQTCVK